MRINTTWRGQLPVRLLRFAKHFTVLPVAPATLPLHKLWVVPLLWMGGFLCKLLDILGWVELNQAFWQLFKRQTRHLTPLELHEAQLVYGSNTLPWQQIRIDEYSVLAKTGAFFRGSHQLGLCLFYTINFTRPLNCTPGNSDMSWLIHELIHVYQMYKLGSVYLIEATYAQHTLGYNYGGYAGLQQGKPFAALNREQQGDIVQDYYELLYENRSTDLKLAAQSILPLYEVLIKQMRSGQL